MSDRTAGIRPFPYSHPMGPSMPLDPRDLSRLCHLLEVALDLPAPDREAWLASLPAGDRPFVPRLREMLAVDQASLNDYLSTGPSLDEPVDDGQPQCGEAVGPYRLIRSIASGGMGDVWLAERADGSLKREIALKLPRLAWGAGLAERMGRERDIGALLEHPHIARLYDAGVDGRGRPYLAFEYVEGEAIDRWCDARRLTVRARLRLFLQVAQAVGHAHGRLVVHRDLKPSNVLVTADGQARLLDFGIAKLIAETPAVDDQLTRRMGRMLTPAYASPEQVRDEPLTVASDVYSLGVLLHELLTGTLPFGRGGARHFDATATAEATRPSRLDLDDEAAAVRGCDSARRLASLLSGDLDTIVLKAIRLAPDERYRSVERFADDVQRYLDFMPIAARPPSLAHRLQLFARRHRPAISMAGVGSAMALVLGVLLWQQHARTVAQSARADAVRDFMLDMVEDVEPDQAHAGREVTGRQMVHRGLERARDRFRTEPRLLGEVLSELFRMLNRLRDDEADPKIVTEAHALLERSAPDDDAALNKVRTQLAELALDGNRLDEAAGFAELALQSCKSNETECAKARSYAASVLGTIEGRRGHVAERLAFQRRVIAETEIGFGPLHPEAAIAWYALAVSARNAGEFEEAERAIARAVAINDQATLPASEHAKIRLLQAVVLQDQGRFRAARDLLVLLLKEKPDKAERSRLLRQLGNAELAMGNAEPALAAADQALALLDPSDHGAMSLFLHQTRAMALGLAGRADEALEEMDVVASGLGSNGYASRTMEVIRAKRLRAEILARDRRYAEARTTVDALVDELDASRPGPGIELAQALDLLGCIRRLSGDAPGALALHIRARDAFLMRLKPDHLFVERNALYQARARMDLQPGADSGSAFDAAARQYLAAFDPGSAWRRIVTNQLPVSASRSAPTDVAAMIL